jgi:PAS domain S-box-containing protein
MAIASVVCGILVDLHGSRSTAALHAQTANNRFKQDVEGMSKLLYEFARTLAADPKIADALSQRDRSTAGKAASQQVAYAQKASSFPGDIDIIDATGKLISSTAVPNLPDTRVRAGLIDLVLERPQAVNGYASLLLPGRITLSSAIPVISPKKMLGVVVTSQPLSSEFLSGSINEWTIAHPEITGLQLLVVPNGPAGTPVSITQAPEMVPSELVKSLQARGLSALPKPLIELGAPNDFTYWLPFTTSSMGFAAEGKWWRVCPLLDHENGNVVAVLLFGTPIEDTRSHAAAMITFAIVCGGLVAGVSLFMSRGLTESITRPMSILTKRAKELNTQKRALPPLEGVEGEWLELGELIDTAVSTMRNQMSTLRNQINRQAEEFEERQRAQQESSSQLDQLNRQISNQARQITELSKQLNVANRQTILIQRKLESVLQVSTEAYLLLDQYGNILSTNPVFLNWLGVSEAEIAGRLCFDLVKRPGETMQDISQGQAFARHGGDPAALINQFYPEGIIYNRQKNSSIAVLAHLQPISSDDHSIQGYVMVLRDKSLRSEISHLRTEIVAMLSESIRTPIVHAEVGWQTLLNNTRNMPPPVVQSLGALHENYQNLLGVVDSLLMIYSDFVPPAMVPPKQEVVINRVVADCLDEVAPLARDRQLTLDYKSVSGLPSLSLDKEILHGVIIQLLEKMISITGAGGRVRVESLIKGNAMRIGVLSSGPALPEQEISEMFAGYIEGKHKMESYSSRLSLYLARNNVERIGGMIWAESDRGTAIYFTLPLG